MKGYTVILSLGVLCAVAHGQIVQWNFNSNPADANTSTGTTTADIDLNGGATVSLLGGVTSSFSSGDASGGSSDPASGDDSGLQTTNYAAQGTNSGVCGVQFNGSTVGFENIIVEYDLRHSNTSSRYEQFDYTLDGGATWVTFATFDANAGGDKWYNNHLFDLSAVSGADNNALFGCRVVAVFDPAFGDRYTASTTGSNYAATGTWRFDMVQIYGTPVPEPGSLAAFATGIVGLLCARRRK